MIICSGRSVRYRILTGVNGQLTSNTGENLLWVLAEQGIAQNNWVFAGFCGIDYPRGEGRHGRRNSGATFWMLMGDRIQKAINCREGGVEAK